MDIFELVLLFVIMGVGCFFLGNFFSVKFTRYLIKKRKWVPHYLSELGVTMPVEGEEEEDAI